VFSRASIDAVRILGEPATKETCVNLERLNPLEVRTNNKLKANIDRHLRSEVVTVRSIDRRP